MSRKNHKLVNGRLLQMDKQFSDLKERQKSRIAEWIYTAYREAYLQTGKEPDKEADTVILDSVMEKIEMQKYGFLMEKSCHITGGGKST